MNDRDKHLSDAIDLLDELQRLLEGLEPIHKSSRIVSITKSARAHIEDAIDLPKPSRIRSFVQRIREAA